MVAILSRPRRVNKVLTCVAIVFWLSQNFDMAFNIFNMLFDE